MFISNEDENYQYIEKKTKEYWLILLIKISIIILILYLLYLYINKNNYTYSTKKNATITIDISLLIDDNSIISNNLVIINNHQSTCNQEFCIFKSSSNLFLAFENNDIFLVDNPYQFDKKHILCKKDITCSYEFSDDNIKLLKIKTTDDFNIGEASE